MRTSGILNFHGEQYFILLNDKKYDMEWYCFSRFSNEDIYNKLVGNKLVNPEITSLSQINSKSKIKLEEYLVCSVIYNKTSGTSKITKNSEILLEVIENLGFCKNYKFKPGNIMTDDNHVEGDIKVKEFYGLDSQVSYRIREENKTIKVLNINRSNYFSIELNYSKPTFPKLDIEYFSTDRITETSIAVSSIESLDLQALKSVCDLSFCLNSEDKLTMDFGAVTNKEEFFEMMEDLKSCVRKGLSDKVHVDVALDTETTGLNVYELSENNELRDHVVAIPISWRDNQARVIFIDMAYFDNVPLELVKRELGPYIERPDDFFKRDPKYKKKLFQPEKEIKTERDVVNLIGHNMMFDRRALLNSDINCYFDEDTLQMSFNLNPILFRANNGLKFLENKLLGYAPPELSDLLGKGHEDKYKYIKDKMVAIIYGCCDANGTRMVKKELRKITSDKMYYNYRHQDIPMMNFLAEADWHGIPMNVDNITKCADLVESDLEVIHSFLENYVGVLVATKNEHYSLKCKMDADPNLDENWFKEQCEKIQINPDCSYHFTMKSSDIRKVMYQILDYPIIAYTKGKNPLPSADKNVLNKFMRKKLPVPSNTLKDDIRSIDGERVLIEAKKFNSYKYPIAYVLNLYSKMNKDFTSYYKPIRDDNVEGKLFKRTSFSRIETRRIMNPSQTMSKVAKSNVVPPSDDWYILDFDMSQVELRKMHSRAEYKPMMEKMNNPENDIHTETAAMINGLKPYEVDSLTRKGAKKVNFGYPYGLGDYKMCEDLYGDTTQEHLYETRKLIKNFKAGIKPVVDMLEEDRDKTLIPINISKELRSFLNGYDEDGNEIPIGAVYNDIGFYRLFFLDNLDKKKIGIIRRASGNYPIQSTCAEDFRIVLTRFKRRCYEEGINDKVRWYLTIHDELLCAVHKSVHPFLLYKIIYEECMIKMKDHARYFVGIGLGRTWNEAKSDTAEAPVYFVHRMKKRYESGEFKETWIDKPWEYVAKYMHEYFRDRIHEVLRDLQPDIDSNPIDFNYIYDRFENYTVRAYITDKFACNIPKDVLNKIEDEEERKTIETVGYLESWILEQYGEGKELILPNGKVTKVVKCESVEEEYIDEILDLYDNDVELDSDEYSWSFDEDGICEQVALQFVANKDFEEDEDLKILGDMENATSFSDLVAPSKNVEYKYVKRIDKTLKFDLCNLKQRDFLKKYLLNFKDDKGIKCIGTICNKYYRFCNVVEDIDIYELNKKLESLN